MKRLLLLFTAIFIAQFAAAQALSPETLAKRAKRKNLTVKEWNTDSSKKSRWLDHMTVYDEKGRKIEEVEYDENAIDIDNVFDEYEEIYDLKGEEEAHKVMIERYGENFFEAFKEIGGELRVQNDKLALQILKRGWPRNA